jgi:hypothetical protein
MDLFTREYFLMSVLCPVFIHHQHSYSWQFTASLNNTQKKVFQEDINSSCFREGIISGLNTRLLGNIQFISMGLPILK